jgi:hypothetical protein
LTNLLRTINSFTRNGRPGQSPSKTFTGLEITRSN